MRILKKGNLVDFESPIFIGSNQIEDFKKKMTAVFGENIVFTSFEEPKLKWGTTNPRRYTKEEAIMLSKLDIDEDEISKKIKKSSKAVRLKHSRQLKKLFEQAKKENIPFSDSKNIRRFIEDEFR